MWSSYRYFFSYFHLYPKLTTEPKEHRWVKGFYLQMKGVIFFFNGTKPTKWVCHTVQILYIMSFSQKKSKYCPGSDAGLCIYILGQTRFCLFKAPPLPDVCALLYYNYLLIYCLT